jgi:ribosome-associated protein
MRFHIPEWEIDFTFARSSGPGGQNVNKVNSKAVLRWNVRSSPSLDESTRARLLAKLAGRLTVDGELVISSDSFRDQPRNREDCLEKLRATVAAALHEDRPRKKTKQSRSSRARDQQSKRRDSAKKRLRRSRDFD